MRVLAVDHGERRIGLAISDTTGTIARPMTIINHTSGEADARRLLDIVNEQAVAMLIIGESLDEEGHPNAAGRRARRFADKLRSMTQVPVLMWDESMSTQDARAARIEAGARISKRASRVDALAAAMILQSYLDAKKVHRNGSEAEGH